MKTELSPSLYYPICPYFCYVFVLGSKIPEELKHVVVLVFDECDDDYGSGPEDLRSNLTWNNVEKCSNKFEAEAAEIGISLPTYEDFVAADMNDDKLLSFDEWEDWVMDN